MKRTEICLCVALLTVISCVSCETNTGTVVVLNKANDMIARVVIKVSGQELTISDLAPSQSSTATYQVRTEGHYSIDVEFRSGKHLQKELGYITSGFDVRDQILVTDSDIQISRIAAER